MGKELIFYTFSRSKLERGDFSHFLSLYAPDKLPDGRRLRQMMDAMVFCIEGYDHDEREIHSIPEVRRFYRAFHDAWPYWLYFCNLDQDVLRMMVFCCLDSFTALMVDGRPACVVETNPLEIVQFLKRNLMPMNVICDRAGMFEHLIYARTKAVFEYFGLPFLDQPMTEPGTEN